MAINTLSPAEIEANKDLTDLKPELDFVERNIGAYTVNIANLLSGTRPAAIKTSHESEENCRQMPVEFAKDIISSLPLRSVSDLKEINYNWGAKVFIPGFDENGFLDEKAPCVGAVPLEEFPSDEHPSRILIGNGTNDTIYVSAVPHTVSKNFAAIRAYQTHVFLHEYFHTVERALRGVESAFTDWKREFLATLWNGGDVHVVSNYASTYKYRIKPDMDLNSVALAEQMCECFVGFKLGILPNPQGHTSFEESHPDLCYLMQELCLAKFK